MTDDIKLYRGDCLEVLRMLPDASVDAVVTDPPYGTTECKWDTVIPFEPMWTELRRLIKPRGAIILFGSQPFTSALILSNPKWFRYELIWAKTMPTGFLDARRKPMRSHENILVFAKGRTTYNPQMQSGKPYTQARRAQSGGPALTSDPKILYGPSSTINHGVRYPRSVLNFSNCEVGRGLHPTQKPVALLEYLIRTYTDENNTVLDFTMGSGTTGVAAISTGRRFIGVEIDAHYFDVAQKRIADAQAKKGEVAA